MTSPARWLPSRRRRRIAAGLGAVAVGVAVAAAAPATAATTSRAGAHGAGPARRVVVIDLDNTHLSDMMAMPAVRAWFGQGTLMANDHTDLVPYTHPDYVNEVTGLYDSQTGIMSNYQYDGGQGLSFSYWLDKLGNGAPSHLSAPPWQWWNAQGDSVGAVGWADIELESASEVPHYVSVGSGYTAASYLGFAVHQANGQTVFGTPGDPAVMKAPLLADPSQTVGVHSGGWDANFGPDRSLTAAAALLNQGVQVVYDYIRSAHNSPATGANMAPGTAAYQANLAHYNQSFAAFFADLKAHGMTPANTLVVLTSDEGDHYNPDGELETSAPAWFTKAGLPTSKLTIDGSAANLVYWPDGTNVPLQNLSQMPGWEYLVWGPALSAIHVATSVRADNPQLIQFAKPTYYYEYTGTSTAVTTNPAELWNHGMPSPDVTSLWASFVGPGVPAGRTSQQWADSAGLLPTIQLLTTGRIEPGLDGVAMNSAVTGPAGRLAALTSVYEALNAPDGAFGQAALKISTTAALDTKSRTALMDGLAALVSQRAPVAAALHHLIVTADQGGSVQAGQAAALTARAYQLLAAVQRLTRQATAG
ncbi:MAG TPA: alkaline phosphatase family protein [Trebonia sp.]|nr:alkaline phosphatase family protein [Trebonia sp.]